MTKKSNMHDVLQLLEPKRKMIPIERLNIHRATTADPTGYQRELEQEWIKKKIADGGVIDLFVGRILVGQREDGTYWIVDGQQRTELCRQCGKTHMECDVFESSGDKMEAWVFSYQDEFSRLDKHEKMHAKLIGEDPVMVEINNICTEEGFNLMTVKKGEGNMRWGKIVCLAAILRIHATQKNLRETLLAIKVWWPGEPDAMRMEILTGVSRFLHFYGDMIDTKHATKRFHQITAPGLLREAQKLLSEFGAFHKARTLAVIQALVDAYNKRLSDKLPSYQALMRQIAEAKTAK